VVVKKGETRKLWKIAQETFLHDQYNWTQYTKSLNDFDKEMEAILPPSDSRRRLDRLLLEKGDTDSATFWKKVMEERQRQERRNRKDAWQPVWFKKIEQSNTLGEGKSMWVYCGDYWEQRAQKVELLKDSKDASTLLRPSQVIGSACDFPSYSDPTPEQDTNTDTTDTGTITATDDPKDDDTDTETELEGEGEGWSAGNSSMPTVREKEAVTEAVTESVVVKDGEGVKVM